MRLCPLCDCPSSTVVRIRGLWIGFCSHHRPKRQISSQKSNQPRGFTCADRERAEIASERDEERHRREYR